jgi:hypothetical protein
MFFATVFLLAGCAPEKVAVPTDPVALYQNGALKSCPPYQTVTIEPKLGDVVAVLDEKEVSAMYTWASQKFSHQQEFPAGGIIFVHALPKPDYAPDALFNYYLLGKDAAGKYCYSGGLNGTTPFNKELLGKYGKKNQ